MTQPAVPHGAGTPRDIGDASRIVGGNTVGGRVSWQRFAVCRGLPQIVFLPPENERGRRRARREHRAKQICRDCPVLAECLRHALFWPEHYGVWGATTPAERSEIISQQRDYDPRR